MSKQKNLTSLLIIFLLSFLGWAGWLFEILSVKGWYSLNWLTGPLYSPYFGLLLTALAFIIPFKINGAPLKKLIVPVLLLYIINFICYKIGEQLCLAIYCRFCFWETKDIVIIFAIAFLLFPFFGFFYWLITTKFIRQIKKINILYISLLILSVCFISQLTLEIAPGFGNQTGWVDCVKMGYPVFWTIAGAGLSSLVIAKQKTSL